MTTHSDWWNDLPLIDDPLKWQDEIDNAPASINLRGSARFWKTVEHMLGKPIYRNGAPDFNEVAIELRPGLGLRLSTDADNHWIDFRFVEIAPDDVPPSANPSPREK